MKKIVGFVLCLVILLCLSACGANNTYGNYVDSSEQSSSSIDNVSSETSVVENNHPKGIEGLVDETGTPVGNVYKLIDGQNFTTEFFENFTCRSTVVKTGELKDFDDWKFIDEGKIRKIYRKDPSIYSDYFIYKDYLVDVDIDISWGSFVGDSQSGYTNNKNGFGERIIKNDGTYEYVSKYYDYKGAYTMLDERIMFIDAKNEFGDPFPIYLLVDNDNSLHYAYPKANWF